MEENKHLMEDNMSTDRGLLTVVHGNAKTVEGQGDKTIVVNGLSVSYSDSGTGATPIIFIHGFPFDKSTWQPQIDFFKKTQRVIAYDIRGFGSSQAGKDPMNMSLFATDLVKFMDALEISTAIICGLSMGGYILLNAENRYRSRFKALVLCDTQCIADSAELKEKRNRAIAQIIAGRMEDFAFHFVKGIFCSQTLDTKQELVDRIKKIILSTPIETITGGLNMPTGSIISFKEDKGYGFIKPKDGGDNVYVHISALQASGIDKVVPGQRLTYEIFSKDNKISAVDIKLLT